MIEISFSDFAKQNFDDAGFNLYIVKNGTGDPLYIGISTIAIWDRWFTGINPHISRYNPHFAPSSIGQKILDHLPESRQWKIQLFTFDDCLEYCKTNLGMKFKGTPSLGWLEKFIIQDLRPVLNSANNPFPREDTTPVSEAEIKRQKEIIKNSKEVFG